MSTRKIILTCLSLGLIALASLAFRPVAPVGPPWISIEIPANPLDAPTSGAALLVHTYHHGDPAGYPLTGTAEGLVDGERVSIDLELTKTSRPSVRAVKQQWPEKGYWVLTFKVSRGGDAEASLVVELGPDGGVAESDYYSLTTTVLSTRSVQVVAGDVDAKKIDKALSAMARATD